MPDVRLSESDQRVLHSLLSLEAVPGEPLPSQQVFETLNRLVRCDLLGAVYSDLHGRITRAIDVIPRGAHSQHPGHHGSPLRSDPSTTVRSTSASCTGASTRHRPSTAATSASPATACASAFAMAPTPSCSTASTATTRCSRDRDLALLNMVGPVLQRLVRERPTPRLPSTITLTERRVLSHVAAGRSNAQIAETLVHLGRHGPQAPRERLPQARRQQSRRRHRPAPRLRRARASTCRSARQIRLKANTQHDVARPYPGGRGEDANTDRYPTGVNRICRRGT